MAPATSSRSAARLVLLTCAGTAAVYLGQQRNKGPPPPPRSARASNLSSRDASQADLTLRAPLLAPDDPDHDEDDDRVCPPVGRRLPGGGAVDDAPNDPGTFDPNDFAPTEEDQFHNQRAARRRDVIVESTFLLCIAMQAYVAVKSVSFYYAEGKTARTVLLLAASIVAINAESVYARNYVASCTVRTGRPSPRLPRARAAVPRPRRRSRLRHVRPSPDRGEQGPAIRWVQVQDVRL